MPLPTLVYRLVKGSPLTASEGDNNKIIMRDFMNALETRLDVALNADGTVKKPRALEVTDAGGDDAYAITSSEYSPAALADLSGVLILLRPSFSNEGTATFQFNALAAKNITKLGNQALATGDIKSGMTAALIWNNAGDRFELQNPMTVPPANYFADSGTGSAYQLSPNKDTAFFSEPAAYYDGYTVLFKAGNTSVTNATLRVGSTLSAVPLRKRVAAGLTQPCADGDILGGTVVEATYFADTGGGVAGFLFTPTGRYRADGTTLGTVATVHTFAHSLAQVPSGWRISIRCTNAGGDASYAFNDEIDALSVRGGADVQFFTVAVTSTNIYVIQSSNATGAKVRNKATGADDQTLTAGNWTLIVRAWTV